jgi:DNA-directed RNA polymerase subunit K/omega
MANAKGLKYLVVRDKKTGKFERVSEALARAKQDSEDGREEIEVWEKDPSVQAFTDLMNRALDKPKEQAQDVNLTIHDDVIKHLNAARKRAQSHHP